MIKLEQNSRKIEYEKLINLEVINCQELMSLLNKEASCQLD